MKKIKVLIVDDSAIVRDILSRRLAENPQIEVVGTAPDPFIARNKIESLDIDVVSLDIEMPRMDGLTFLKYLMKYKPMPVIIVSSLTEGKNQAALEAMERGAVDIVNKTGGPFSVEEIAEELAEKIIAASRVSRSNLKKVSLQIQKMLKHSQRQSEQPSHKFKQHKNFSLSVLPQGEQSQWKLFSQNSRLIIRRHLRLFTCLNILPHLLLRGSTRSAR